MNSSIGVVIATYGDEAFWQPYVARAVASVHAQTCLADQLVVIHGDSLHGARNQGAEQLDTDWIIFLDADDELDPHYLEAMCSGDGDLRQPATLGVVEGREDPSPVVLPAKHLLDGNYIVIGAMCSRDRFLRLGGFRDLPAWEDWDLWIRFWLDGAVVTAVPSAVYRVHVRTGSRNHLDPGFARQLFKSIREQYLGPAQEVGLA